MLRKIIAEEAVTQCRKLIDKSEKMAIITHISPDGDALGSALGLYWFLHNRKKDVKVIVPNAFPDFLKWLKGSENIIQYIENKPLAEQAIQEAELIFFLDFNEMNRIDGLKTAAIDAQGKKVLIDHHPHPDIYCDVKISHTDISSTSELIFRLICRMGYFQEMSFDTAECIYTGMMTDTGNFSFNSQSADIYFIIEQLLSKGIQKDEIFRRVYNTYSLDRMKLMGYCLSKKLRIYPEQKTAFMALTLNELEQFNYQAGDSEGLVNMPLQIKDIDVSIFARQDKDKIKISFRSVGDFPVNKVAEEFKGGGHINAAGGESYKSMRQTIEKMEKVILNRKNYENQP
jgi:phosphoesterase RecJ-like protein